MRLKGQIAISQKYNHDVLVGNTNGMAVGNIIPEKMRRDTP